MPETNRTLIVRFARYIASLFTTTALPLATVGPVTSASFQAAAPVAPTAVIETLAASEPVVTSLVIPEIAAEPVVAAIVEAADDVTEVRPAEAFVAPALKSFMLARRLKAVSKLNGPTEAKSRKSKTTPPAGRPVPKAAAAASKSTKQKAPVAQAWIQVRRDTSRNRPTATVIDFNKARTAMGGQARVQALRRAA